MYVVLFVRVLVVSRLLSSLVGRGGFCVWHACVVLGMCALTGAVNIFTQPFTFDGFVDQRAIWC